MIEENLNTFGFKKIMFRILLISLTSLLLILIDLFLGSYNETNYIKASSRMFRSEATSLSVNTRALTPNIDHSYFLGLRHDPYFEGDHNAPRLFRTDENGTIIGQLNPAKTTSKGNILFLGGSITECNEVDEEYRFPSLAGKILSEETSSAYRGINLGVRGHTSHDSINLLLNHPISDQAQIVVLMNNINDRLFLAKRGTYKAPLNLTSPTMWDSVVWSTKSLIEKSLELLFISKQYFIFT